MPHPLDLGSRKFWRLIGRVVDLDGGESWLQAPMSRSPKVADGWLAAEAARLGGTLAQDDGRAGLLPSLAVLDGPGFDAARGMDSQVTVISDGSGTQVAAARMRTLRSSGRHVFSGSYSARALPGADRPSVHVAFPLESGNIQVFLRPSVTDDGGLVLESPPGGFGRDGACVVVRDGRDFAACAPLNEPFHVYVDDRGLLRTDHELSLRKTWAVRLHDKLERAS